MNTQEDPEQKPDDQGAKGTGWIGAFGLKGPFARLQMELSEESVLFISVVKWFFLASAAGAFVGMSTAIFLMVLQWSERLQGLSPYYFLVLPIGMAASAAIIHYVAPTAKGHGTEKVIEAVHKRAGHVNPLVTPVKLVATVVTLAAGGSVGKEGPAAQIGAGVCSIFADILHLNDEDRRKLVICGISGGFAAVFGTPIAGAIFGIEVLFCGRMLYEVLLPAFVAGMTGYHVATLFGIQYFAHPTMIAPELSEAFFLTVAFAGVFFGITSLLMIDTMTLGDHIAEKIKIHVVPKALLGGLVLVGLAFVFSPMYLGLGLDQITGSLNGRQIVWYAFLIKMVFTSVTLSFGGSGGIVTPIFFVGATAGTVFAQWFHLDPLVFAAIGLVSVVAGSANTPIAASIMAVELFGPEIAVYAASASVISFLMTGHRSVYPSQVLAFRKSASLHVPLGRELDELPVEVRLRDHTVLGTAVKVSGLVGKKLHNHMTRQRRLRLKKRTRKAERVNRSDHK